MKVSIRKVKTPIHKEYLVMIEKRSVAICLCKEDAKFVAKCIRKYNGRRGNA